ncbi:facilitated trehalose transporter Tret1-2 homolog [Plutella xylostella]|uniref:facilitated trehalose transporter Tret1-2 homolog n=1 Tax=Plutella xylostella TaxID=51655 RepID=UPI002032FAA4|nr:facilitated trehalose transporter Tret1-2 homolog [Plutella xylostella]
MLFGMRNLGLFKYLRWREGSRGNQYIMGVLVNFPTVCFGMLMGWVSPVTPQLQSAQGPLPRPMTDGELGWMASVAFCTAVPMMLVSGVVADRIGRKATLMMAPLSIALCWLLTIIWTNSAVIILARTITGVAAAVCYAISPVYVKEVSDDDIRGALGSLLILAQNLGFVIMYVLCTVLDFYSVAYVSLAMAAAHAVVFLNAPDTPSYLIKCQRNEEAAEVLAWLRSVEVSDKRVTEEISKLQADDRDQANEKPAWRDLFSDRTTRKALYISAVILILQEFCGYLILLTYASTVFGKANVGSALTANEQTIVLGCVLFIGSVCACFLIEKVGRKPLLAATSTLSGLGMLVLGSWFYVTSRGHGAPGWVPITAMGLSLFCAAAGFQPTPFVIMPEMFTFKLRGTVSSLTIALTGISDFVQTEAFSYVNAAIGLHGAFWIFAAVGFVCAVFTIVCVPETRNKSVEEIYAEMRGEKKTEDIDCSTVL